MHDFDVAALSAALDARRVELGLTWQQVAHQITERPNRWSERRIAASTFKDMARRGAVRDTVVLQVLRWLGRTPESFVPGLDATSGHVVPDDDTGRPTFDASAIYAALNDTRTARSLTWRDVAAELGRDFDASVLTRLAAGAQMGFPRVMRLFQWLERPAADFVVFVPDED